MRWIYPILGNRTVLMLLFLVNIAGTVYGYYWYGYQLEQTPPIFLAFVPDSPTASLFFVFVLLAFLLKKNWPLIEALAIVTLFKYGIWAVVMNFLVLMVQGELDWTGYMLIGSHFAMAVQGVLYSPFYKMKAWHLMVAAIWTLHNDIIDYVFFMMPNYSMLNQYIPEIGYFTFWLSITSIGVAYYFCIRTNRFKLEI
ncbi:lipoprotein heptaprenylglyceryl N-acetyltransferase LhaT [Neobacillus sp. Marseille-QA0830]